MEEERNESVTDEVKDVPTTSNKSKNKNGIIIITVAVLIAVGIVVYAAYFKDSDDMMDGKGADIVNTVEKKPYVFDEFDETKLIASVNGDEILQGELMTRFKQVIYQIELQGGTVVKGSEDAVKLKEQVLDNLINDRLLLQKAEKENLTATAEEIDNGVADIIKQVGSEEDFNSQLARENMTLDDFRKLVEGQIIIQKYILQSVDLDSISVSEEEINDFYARISEGKEGVPSLEEVRPQVESEISGNKQRELVLDFLKSLRDAADINISL